MLAERKMAGLGKTSGQWRAELQQEKEKVDFWKRKHPEAETQQNLMREELTDRRVENVNLRTQISELEASLQMYENLQLEAQLAASQEENAMMKEQVEDLECSLQTCQEELESFKELQEYEKARWEAQLQHSQDQVRNRDHVMRKALVQIRDVAEHLQTLAVQADVISVQTELESTRGKRLASLLREIKLLGSRAKRYM
ncbi:hypothetical protein V6N12_024731 [Hibiscus sabdariffa]|uniref:Uncharacterized protein n=1 Tax=Hibiscus sabdariffa TaxID=183260 RepID=A0ABR2BF58_9ROSI